MSRIHLEPDEIPARNFLNRFRKPFEMPPEAGCCPMHLECFKLALLFRVHGFRD